MEQRAWPPRPVPPPSGAGEIRCGYLHLCFPRAAVGDVLGLVDAAVAERGWELVPGDSTDDGPGPARPYHRGWRHRGGTVRLAYAVIGFHPVAVTVGRVHPAAVGRRLVRGTLFNLLRRSRALGGVPLADAALLAFHADAQRRAARATAIAFEIEQLEFAVAHRRCPRCTEWGRPRERWCWSCRYEFTGEDDHVFDAATAAARQRVDWLRNQGLDGPNSAPPAAPPLSALGLAGLS